MLDLHSGRRFEISLSEEDSDPQCKVTMFLLLYLCVWKARGFQLADTEFEYGPPQFWKKTRIESEYGNLWMSTRYIEGCESFKLGKKGNLSSWVQYPLLYSVCLVSLLIFWSYGGMIWTLLFCVHLESSVSTMRLVGKRMFLPLGPRKSHLVMLRVWLGWESMSLPWDWLLRGHISARRTVKALVGERMSLLLGLGAICGLERSSVWLVSGTSWCETRF